MPKITFPALMTST